MGHADQAGLVAYELRGSVAVLTLNRPEKRNAISDNVLSQIDFCVEKAGREARAAVLCGAGEHFCAGLDLAEHAERPLLEAITNSRQWHRVFERIERGSIPFVAALSGAVVGGGFELAAAAHIRVADETAYFGLPEGKRGIFVGGGGSVRIARLIGASRMADMMLTGRVARAEEIERWGGVNYLTPAGQATAKAFALAEAAAGNAPMSNFAVINALPRIQDMSSEDGLFTESLMASLTTETEEAKMGLRAFLEKRAGKVAPDDE